jgi:hypothetical protein
MMDLTGFPKEVFGAIFDDEQPVPNSRLAYSLEPNDLRLIKTHRRVDGSKERRFTVCDRHTKKEGKAFAWSSRKAPKNVFE